MARKKQNALGKVASLIGMTVGTIVSVGVGGLFVRGDMLTVPILELLPEAIHSVTGWIVVVGALLSLIFYLINEYS